MRDKGKHILHTDGGSRGNPGPSAYGAVLYNHDGKVVWMSGKYLGHSTNNRAEYEGIVRGLFMAKRKGAKNIVVYADSDLAIKQITGKWRAKDASMKKLLAEVRDIADEFDSIEFHHTPRENNSMADRIVNIVLDAVEQNTN